ncbi:MAG: glycosyltransferase family 2 protein [Pseudorhodobacter sp.]|nr:glycosyltransferase family 2 protein [Pseudorhodobacter sp.]
MSVDRLSVIIPFHDEPAFIQMALRSVLAQAVSGLEVIIVNDNPAKFAPAFFEALKLPASVRVLHHAANRGLSAARNTGIDAATGARVAFLDADDYYLSDGLAAQLALAERSGADITHANCCISPVGAPELRLLPRDRALFNRPCQGAGLRGVEQAQFITSSWSSLYRRDFLQGAGLRFDPEQVRFEDRLFVLASVTAAGSIACLGAPVRVWRRRTGSISVTPPGLTAHRLQVQLLEKCMALMRAHALQPGMPRRFVQRELFNTLSRLIWDMDLITAISGASAPEYAGLGQRIAQLLGEEACDRQVFQADPVIAPISRVGKTSRLGIIRRGDFRALHQALRAADFTAAAALIAGRAAPVPPKRRSNGVHLVLHLGMHKTGSTYLQRCLAAGAEAMRAAGVLYPQTGLAAAPFVAVRPGGFPGHLGLLTAALRGRGGPWQKLDQEITQSGCKTVVLSCEGMLLPLAADRQAQLARLFERLSSFASCRVLAFVRRPDVAPEMLYREQACNGLRLGARSAQEFMVDYGDILTDLPGLFAPFEAFSGHPVALVDHDRSLAEGAHWRNFLAAAGLAGRLGHIAPAAMARIYASPDRDQVAAARLANVMLASEHQRVAVLRGFFAAKPPVGSSAMLLSPAYRLALLAHFAATSARFAAARGYAPDLDRIRAELAAEDWLPPAALSADLLERLQQARLQAETAGAVMGQGDFRGAPGLLRRIRPRPWLGKSLDWVAAHWHARRAR